jgi:dihydropteroate synthase
MTPPFAWDDGRTLVMGILNVTPDSFSDGGKFLEVDQAVARARAMVQAGADIIDIGGESTRPGSQPVSVADELRRVLPVIKALPDLVVAIDTTKDEVARQAVAAGAQIINDISASLFAAAGDTGAGLVLMHMQGTPATMQQSPRYADVVHEVREFLADRIALAEAHGVKKTQIAVDPGIGFGKTVEHNRQLLAQLEQFRELGCPILVGASRKSFLGGQVHERLPGSLAAAAWAVAHGARIVRVHDVAETVAVVRLIETLKKCNT